VQLGKLVQTRKPVLKEATPADAAGHGRETLETAERDELGLLVLQRQIIQGAPAQHASRRVTGRQTEALSPWTVGGAHVVALRPPACAPAEQDEQLDDLARVVTNTRHIALAVNEELDLHTRLLVRHEPWRVLQLCMTTFHSERFPASLTRLTLAQRVSAPSRLHRRHQDDIEDDVENTPGRLHMATRKIKLLMKQSRDCKLMLCLMFTIAALIAILVLVIKVAPYAG
jgi:hypothetical protein